MREFIVRYDGGIFPLISKVYSVKDSDFLIADGVGQFFWVNMGDCTLVEED